MYFSDMMWMNDGVKVVSVTGNPKTFTDSENSKYYPIRYSDYLVIAKLFLIKLVRINWSKKPVSAGLN